MTNNSNSKHCFVLFCGNLQNNFTSYPKPIIEQFIFEFKNESGEIIDKTIDSKTMTLKVFFMIFVEK
jgi:hypothetical protein